MSDTNQRPSDFVPLLSDLGLKVGDVITVRYEDFDNTLFRIVSYDQNGCDEMTTMKALGYSAAKRPGIRVEQILSLNGHVCRAVKKAAKSHPLIRLDRSMMNGETIKKMDLISILLIRDQVDRIARSGDVL